MAMDQRLCRLPVERQIPSARCLFLDDKFFQQKSRSRDRLHRIPLEETGVFITECKNAAGLAPYERIAPSHERFKPSNVKIRVRPGLLRQPLGDHRPSAALAFDKLYLVTRGFEESRGGNANFRIVKVDKG